MRSEAKPVSRTLHLKLFLMGSKILIQFEFSTQVPSRLITKSQMRVRKEITWMEAQVDDSPARSRASEGFTWPGQRRMFVCITCRDGMSRVGHLHHVDLVAVLEVYAAADPYREAREAHENLQCR